MTDHRRAELTDTDLAVIEQIMAAHHDEFQSYVDDPRMEGQPDSFIEVARSEAARVKPVLDKVRSLRAT